MAVTASRPRVASHDVRDGEWQAMRFRAALLEYARELREAARETVAHAQALRIVLQEWQASTLARRCAWCSRYYVGDRWVALRATPHHNRTTHSICDDCAEALRDAGLSR